jgi:hypothetical protein
MFNEKEKRAIYFNLQSRRYLMFFLFNYNSSKRRIYFVDTRESISYKISTHAYPSNPLP